MPLDKRPQDTVRGQNTRAQREGGAVDSGDGERAETGPPRPPLTDLKTISTKSIRH